LRQFFCLLFLAASHKFDTAGNPKARPTLSVLTVEQSQHYIIEELIDTWLDTRSKATNGRIFFVKPPEIFFLPKKIPILSNKNNVSY
jgi:hypothetical protein